MRHQITCSRRAFLSRAAAASGMLVGTLAGRRVLLVNWSPHCGFCAEIAPDLVLPGFTLAVEANAAIFADVANQIDARYGAGTAFADAQASEPPHNARLKFRQKEK